MSNIADRRVVQEIEVLGRTLRIERIVWRNSTGLSFDVYDDETGLCLTAESMDDWPTESDLLDLLAWLRDDLDGDTLDHHFTWGDGEDVEKLRQVVAQVPPYDERG